MHIYIYNVYTMIHIYIYIFIHKKKGNCFFSSAFRLRPLENFWRKLLTLESKGPSVVWEGIMLSESPGGPRGASLKLRYKMGPY